MFVRLTAMSPIDPARFTAHLRHLTETIGVRLAGQPGEKLAGDYLARQFAAVGARVSVEAFPVQSRAVTEQQLQVFHDGTWHDAGCSLFSNTPGTDGAWREAPLEFFDAQTGYQQEDLPRILGSKVVLHLGTHIESPDHYRRLVEARPAAVLMVDARFPGPTALADAIFPHYTRQFGAVTTLNVAYLEAWRWRERDATRARWRVVGGPQPAESANIVAELPGREPAAGIVYLGAHHDTQADSVGADDNAAASAGLVEIARVLAPLPRRRSIRLVSFGAEEQLSVGSAAYVRRHRAELEAEGGCMLNLDSFGSLLGWNVLNGVVPPALEPRLAAHFARHGQRFRRDPSALPYFDHFPFLAAGVPGVTLIRYNCTAGRFFHHRPDDTLDRLDVPLMAAALGAFTTLADELANVEPAAFPRSVPSSDLPAIQAHWQGLFGGWEG